MNYADERGRFRCGNLLAWSHRAWGSWYDLQIQAVRMFTRSEYCHVGICWVVSDRVFVLEAVGTGVRIFPLSRLTPFFHFELGANWPSEVEAWALRQVGEPYSKWQAVLAGVGMLKAGEDSIWQCAEYAQAVLSRLGVDLPGDATPSNLVQQAQMRGAVGRYINGGANGGAG